MRFASYPGLAICRSRRRARFATPGSQTCCDDAALGLTTGFRLDGHGILTHDPWSATRGRSLLPTISTQKSRVRSARMRTTLCAGCHARRCVEPEVVASD